MVLMLGMGFGVFCVVVVFLGDLKGDRYHRRCKEWLRSNGP